MKNTSEIRRNPISGTVVIIGHERKKTLEQLQRKNPRDWSKIKPGLINGEDCPFELGKETQTPSEMRAYRAIGTSPDTPGWWVRTVPNLFPAVSSSIPSELLEEEEKGPFLVTPPFGYHFLIVEAPEHSATLATLPKDKIREVVYMWRDLIHSVGSDRNIRHVFIFENYGPLAGASQPHPHSQLIALPMIPPRILNELRGAKMFYENNRRCFYCTEIEWELRVEERLVTTTDNFVAWCPFTSKTPYQVIISPKAHQGYFANIATHPQGRDPLTEFSHLLQETLLRIKKALNDPDYNLYFHTTPTSQPEMSSYHWHCQIEPITEAIIAGFEKGSGVYINSRPPESAAADLRDVKLGG